MKILFVTLISMLIKLILEEKNIREVLYHHKKRLGQNSFYREKEAGTKQKGTRPKKLASNRRKESLSLLKFSFLPFWLLLYRISCLLAVYFRKFTAINAIPISFSTLDFPR